MLHSIIRFGRLGAVAALMGMVSPVLAQTKILPPAGGGVYLGVYNWAGDGLLKFEQVLGRKVAIGNPYAMTDGGAEGSWPSFDAVGHERNWQAGYVTWFSVETSLGSPAPTFTPQDVINGVIDTNLEAVARAIRNWGRPILWAYPREPSLQPGVGYDGGGYGPSGTLRRAQATGQGLSDTAAYGSPSKLDGPERYVDMCRHIHDVVAPIASNVTWVAGAIVSRQPGGYAQWYPGDAYADWHAINLYVGTESETVADTFAETIEPDWSEALAIAPHKPVMLLEMGVGTFLLGDRSAWFTNFFASAKTTHPQLGAFIYWQSNADGVDSRIAASDPAADDWSNEVNGASAAWWRSNLSIETRVATATLQGAGVKLGLEEVAVGRTSRVERSTASASGPWTTVGSFVGQAPAATWTGSVGAEITRAFFRVRRTESNRPFSPDAGD